jgi:hypothetical protein
MNMKWEPAIYEHKANLIGRRPAEVANSAALPMSKQLSVFVRNGRCSRSRLPAPEFCRMISIRTVIFHSVRLSKPRGRDELS